MDPWAAGALRNWTRRCSACLLVATTTEQVAVEHDARREYRNERTDTATGGQKQIQTAGEPSIVSGVVCGVVLGFRPRGLKGPKYSATVVDGPIR